MNPKKKAAPSVVVYELKTKEDWALAYPLIAQLNQAMTKRRYQELLKKMLPIGYRCVGATMGGKLVGLCGFWTGTRFWCGDYMALDNVITDQKVRSKGIGAKMTAWVEKEARRKGCAILELDSYTTAYRAHRFYFREGYCILGYHFTKKL